ncbi:MAG: hypothetical protein EBS42_02065, partial [Caulobacteraceae bacterium]|nr:hypothetical protein [Caulobacteraceae bacterium]
RTETGDQQDKARTEIGDHPDNAGRQGVGLPGGNRADRADPGLRSVKRGVPGLWTPALRPG